MHNICLNNFLSVYVSNVLLNLRAILGNFLLCWRRSRLEPVQLNKCATIDGKKQTVLFFQIFKYTDTALINTIQYILLFVFSTYKYMKSTTIFEEVIVAEDMDESMNPFFYTCIYNINLLFSILSNTHIIYFAIENEFHPSHKQILESIIYYQLITAAFIVLLEYLQPEVNYLKYLLV